MLVPAWLSSAWIKMTGSNAGCDNIMAAGLLLLSITYFTALTPGKNNVERKALVWIGGLALLPAAIAVIFADNHIPPDCQWGWLPALGLPLGLAWWLRRRAAGLIFWLRSGCSCWQPRHRHFSLPEGRAWLSWSVPAGCRRPDCLGRPRIAH